MSITERFAESSKQVNNKILWIIFVPIALDVITLFSWEKLFHTIYIPAQKLFMIKLGIIGAPPSVKFLLEDFPAPLFKYDNNGFTGIINTFSVFNITLVITIILITSFLSSGYMNIIGTRSAEKAKIRDFFIKGNKTWHKFFLLNCITMLPLLLTIINRAYIILSIVNIVFIYVEYSFVTDEVSLFQNFKLGIAFLFSNFGLTIKMALYFGFVFSIASLLVFPLAGMGSIGIIADIAICAYLGTCVNRAVFGIYEAERNNLNGQNQV